MSYDSVVDALGDNPEYGTTRRVTLPKSKYLARLVVNAFDVTPGGTPYVELLAHIAEGPFAGQEPRSRVYITPGGPDSKGGHIAFVNAATKRVTGKQPDMSALADIGADLPERGEFPGGDEGDGEYRQAIRFAVRDAFVALAPDARASWAMKYARLREWDGKLTVVSLDVEYSEDKTKSYNRIQGFYATNDPKYGVEHVRKVCHPEQQKAAEEMAHAEVAGA